MPKNDFQYGRCNYYTLQCGTIMTLISPKYCTLQCGSGIMTVNSPSDSTLQCDMWLWDHMPLNSPVVAPSNVTHSSGIMALNSPGGSTLKCGRWLRDDMPWNLPKRPPYWNSTPGFDFDHITAVDMSFCTSLQYFIQIGPPTAEKMTSFRFSVDTVALNCLVFEKIAFLYFGDRQTNEHNLAVRRIKNWKNRVPASDEGL